MNILKRCDYEMATHTHGLSNITKDDIDER